jgi:GNAT superfamily N-acetyltransferase
VIAARYDGGVIHYEVQPHLADDDLNELFEQAWSDHRPRPFGLTLARSLTWVAAFDERRLVGFVNVAWDGGVHGFILDTTVHPQYQRRGIGRELVTVATRVARERGLEWLHVDYEPMLQPFYGACGFRPCRAGLIRLSSK